MEESHSPGSRKLLKKFGPGTAKHSHQLSVDSPLYDASEEDNTDDGSATGINQPWSRTGQQPLVGGGSIIQGGSGVAARQRATFGRTSANQVAASSRLAHVAAIDAGDSSGVDSPTYDGDVETNTAVPSSKQHSPISPISSKPSLADLPPLQPPSSHPASTLSALALSPNEGPAPQNEEQVLESLLSLPGPTTTTPASPVSSTYPDPPSSAVSTAEYDGTDDERSSLSNAPAPVPRRSTATNPQRPSIHLAGPSTSSALDMMIPQHSAIPPPHPPPPPKSGTTPKAADRMLLPDTAPHDVEYAGSDEDESLVNTSMLSAEEIRTFIQKAIDGDDEERAYKINPPPMDRPARVYADGVYDMFHFGHALQLRQAKLSFPSVHLLVGVPSDELCITHKARTVLSHFERLESVRHCRWADEVVPDAPWILDESFLEKYKIDYVAHDEEPYAGPGGNQDIYKPVKDLGKFLPTRRTPGISTSHLLERLVSRYRLGDFDGKLEKIGHGELSARGSQYDDSRPGSRMGNHSTSGGNGTTSANANNNSNPNNNGSANNANNAYNSRLTPNMIREGGGSGWGQGQGQGGVQGGVQTIGLGFGGGFGAHGNGESSPPWKGGTPVSRTPSEGAFSPIN